MILAVPQAMGAASYWDINGSNAGVGSATPSGNWSATDANWSTDSAGGATTAGWTSGNTAVFSAGTEGTGAYTITLIGTQTVNGVNFEDTNASNVSLSSPSLSGGTLNIAGGSITGAAGGTNGTRRPVFIDSALTGTAGVTFDMAGAGVTTYTLSGNNSGLTGKILIGRAASGGLNDYIELVPTNDNALGAAGAGNEIDFTAAPNAAATVVDSRIRLTGGRTINKNIIIRGGGDVGTTNLGAIQSAGDNTWAGNITLSSNSTSSNGTGAAICVTSGTLVVTGQLLQGTGTLSNGFFEKIGPGTLALEKASTASANFFRHNGGILEIRANGALGSASTPGKLTTGTTLVTPHETGPIAPIVAFRAPASAPAGFNYSTYELIRFASQRATTVAVVPGTGVDNFGGANTFGGDIMFGEVNTGVGQYLSSSVGSLEMSGHLWATTQNLPRIITKAGAGEIIISNTNNATDGVSDGAGATFDADQYALTAGTFSLTAGTLTFRKTGTLNGGMALTVGPVTTLKLDNGTNAINNRVLATTQLPLTAGNVQLLGNSTSSTSQTFATLDLVGAMSDVTVSQPTTGNASTTTMTVNAALNRTLRSTAQTHGLNGSSALLTVTGTPANSMIGGSGAAGSTQVNILPWVANTAVDNSVSDLVTVGDGSGSGTVRPLAGNEYAALTNGNAALDNVAVTSAGNGGINNLTANLTEVNGLKLGAGSTVSIGSGKRLWVYSGAIVTSGTGTTTISGGNLAFEQYYNPGTFNSSDVNASTTGAYDQLDHTDPAPVGITDGQIPNTAHEAVISVQAGSTLVQAADNVISSASGLTKSGAGTLKLLGNNTFGRGRDSYSRLLTVGGQPEQVDPLTPEDLYINAGRLEFQTDANLGNTGSTISINGGTLAPIQNNVTIVHPVNLRSIATNAIDVGSLLDQVTFSGVFSGNALTKTGAGTLTLSNLANTYGGGTFINAGYIRLLDTSTNQSQLGGANGVVTLNGGSLRADATLTMDHSLKTVATDSVSGFFVAGGATLTFGGSGSSTAVISGTGNITKTGPGTLVLGNQAGANTYTGDTIAKEGVIDYVGANGVATLPAQKYTAFTLDGGTFKFDVSSTAAADISSGFRGMTVTSNNGTVDVSNTFTVDNFGGLAGPGTLTKAGAGTFRLRASNTSVNWPAGNPFTGKFHITNGTLSFIDNGLLGSGSGSDFITMDNNTTLQGFVGAVIDPFSTTTLASNQGITMNVANATIDVDTNMTVNIPGDITATNTTTLNKTSAGTLGIKNFRGGTLNIAAGKVQVLQTNNSNNGTSVVSTLTTGANQLDITNNKLVITTPGAQGVWTGSAYDGTAGLVATGRAPNLSGVPQWTGAGIVTSQTAAKSSYVTAIAVATAGQVGKSTFGGQSVNPTDTLVMYTYNGDANMSGKVDADDYFVIDSNYNKSGTVFGWVNGDFNYDGKVNGDDYLAIDSGWMGQGSPILPGGLPGGVSAVPEPTSLALLGLAAMGLTRRRRRSN